MFRRLLSISCLLASFSSSFAADIYVREFGTDGAYETISEALDAAANGDRIYIEKKSNNQNYVEDLTISKNIRLLAMGDLVKIPIEGDISIQLSGGELDLIGIQLIGDITSDSSTTITSQVGVKLLSCHLRVVSLSDGTHLTMAMSTASKVTTFKGNFYGNDLDFIHMPAGNFAYDNDRLEIYGNYIGKRVLIDNALHIENPFLCHIKNNYARFREKGILIETAKNGVTHEIMNNFLYQYPTVASAKACIEIGSSITEVCQFKIYNNVFRPYSVSSSATGVKNASNTAEIDLSYNMFHNNIAMETEGEFANIYGNYYDESFPPDWDDSYFNFKGHPSSMYYNVSPSRNTLGPKGGSFYIGNYQPSSTVSSHVYRLHVPERILIGEKITIEAEAFDR